MNYELIVISLIVNLKLNIIDFTFKKEFFRDKNNFIFLKYIQESVLNGLSQEESIQKFLVKNITFNYINKEELENILNTYTKESLLELFYDSAINFIWINHKNNKDARTSKLEDIYKITEEIKVIISQIEDKKEKKNPFDSFRKEMERIREISNSQDNGIVGYETGMFDIDRITGGMKDGNYVIIGGRPSMGKTSLALDIAIENAKKGKNVLIMSIEMTSNQIIARCIPKLNRTLTLNNVVNGVNLEEKMESIISTSKYMEELPIEIEDFSDNINVKSLDIKRRMEKYRSEHGFYPDLVILDYIQKIGSENLRASENEAVTEVSNIIQRLGKTTGSLFIVLSQLNRSLEERDDKRPMNSDLRNSGSLEQDADLILFVYRDSVYLEKSLRKKMKNNPDSQEIAEALRFLNENENDSAEIIISKNRNGTIGTANVEFYKPTASYVQDASLMNVDFDF